MFFWLVILSLTIVLYWIFWRNPQQKMNFYRESFEKLGYKVLMDDYNPFTISSFKRVLKGSN